MFSKIKKPRMKKNKSNLTKNFGIIEFIFYSSNIGLMICLVATWVFRLVVAIHQTSSSSFNIFWDAIFLILAFFIYIQIINNLRLCIKQKMWPPTTLLTYIVVISIFFIIFWIVNAAIEKWALFHGTLLIFSIIFLSLKIFMLFLCALSYAGLYWQWGNFTVYKNPLEKIIKNVKFNKKTVFSDFQNVNKESDDKVYETNLDNSSVEIIDENEKTTLINNVNTINEPVNSYNKLILDSLPLNIIIKRIYVADDKKILKKDFLKASLNFSFTKKEIDHLDFINYFVLIANNILYGIYEFYSSGKYMKLDNLSFEKLLKNEFISEYAKKHKAELIDTYLLNINFKKNLCNLEYNPFSHFAKQEVNFLTMFNDKNYFFRI